MVARGCSTSIPSWDVSTTPMLGRLPGLSRVNSVSLEKSWVLTGDKYQAFCFSLGVGTWRGGLPGGVPIYRIWSVPWLSPHPHCMCSHWVRSRLGTQWAEQPLGPLWHTQNILAQDFLCYLAQEHTFIHNLVEIFYPSMARLHFSGPFCIFMLLFLWSFCGDVRKWVYSACHLKSNSMSLFLREKCQYFS